MSGAVAILPITGPEIITFARDKLIAPLLRILFLILPYPMATTPLHWTGHGFYLSASDVTREARLSEYISEYPRKNVLISRKLRQ